MFVWDEKKRLANLEKHGLDFKDAGIVYHHPEKATFESIRNGETRIKDIVYVRSQMSFVVLVYVERGDDVRIISFRRASRSELPAPE